MKTAKKIMLTPIDKKMIQKARQQIAAGKGIPLADFLVQALAHDAKKHARS